MKTKTECIHSFSSLRPFIYCHVPDGAGASPRMPLLPLPLAPALSLPPLPRLELPVACVRASASSPPTVRGIMAGDDAEAEAAPVGEEGERMLARCLSRSDLREEKDSLVSKVLSMCS